MSKNRKESYDSIIANIGVPVTLVTDQNLRSFVKSDFPIHKAYEFLSATHKCDYLRTYFMCHYGGGYTDIKRTTTSWIKAFEDIEKDSNIWANGYREVDENGVAVPALRANYKDLIGNGAYIIRPNTPLTQTWMDRLHAKLDALYENLKKNPASEPRDVPGKQLVSGKKSKYPVIWNELLGQIFHGLCFQYRDHLAFTVPTPQFTNYI